MQINRKFATLGAFLFITPFLGIPDSWKSVLTCLLAVAVIFTAIDFEKSKKKSGRRKTDKIKMNETFSENNYTPKKMSARPLADYSGLNTGVPDDGSPL